MHSSRSTVASPSEPSGIGSFTTHDTEIVDPSPDGHLVDLPIGNFIRLSLPQLPYFQIFIKLQ